jgi:cellulose biosynthesis protein BcsQ
VLCDPDREYTQRIAWYVRESSFRKEMEITICSSTEALQEWMAVNPLDIAVVSVTAADRLDSKLFESISILWLTDGEPGEGPYGFPMVSKYETAPRLLQRFVHVRPRKQALLAQKRRAAPITAVWSVAGGVGKTRLSSMLAAEWLRKGRSVFLFGTDPGFYDMPEAYGVTYHDASEWMYAVKTGKPIAPDSEDLLRNPSLHSFHPDTSLREFAALGVEEGGALLEAASLSFGCEGVLVDTAAGWSPFTEYVWRRCDVLLFLSAAEPFSLGKTNQWLERWPGWDESSSYRVKSWFILNKCLKDNQEPKVNWQGDITRLPYVPEWKQSRERVDPLFQQRFHRFSEELWKRCMRRV